MAGGAKVSLSMGVQVGMGSLSLIPPAVMAKIKYLTDWLQVSDYSACTPTKITGKKL